ncbi:MAG: phosphoribosylglycinamide formyltransferase [Armatimonadota bacterium]|nr:phosphoribosylglycinamide formyltransferase [Armatimonadota bacterium]MDR7454864.1 phosphoribosylglycinamide formyltransferase [Armatimonadota bacterium]MDR7497703.1 phosphoribosylglycinamide formyltransferase [Armatimonadota bacterium]
MTRVVVLASGQGSTLQALLDAFPPDGGAEGIGVAAVVCNTPGARALDRARRAGVPAILVDHRGRSREAFEAELCRAIDAHRPDLVCLAGFLRILSPEVAARYAGRMLNTHPALLPAFGGKGMYGERVHQAVLAAGAAVSGCTIHLVDATPDGGPIVAQAAVPVLPDDVPERLAARVQAEERRLYPQVVRWFARGRLQVAGRRPIWRDGEGAA